VNFEKYNLLNPKKTFKPKNNMKNTILAVVLMMGVSAATTTAIANDDMKIVEVKNFEANDLNIIALKGLKFKLSVNNVEKRTLISLVNEEKEVLFSEYAALNGDYSKIFDLSNLTDGKYSFILRTGGDKVTKEFEIKTTTKRSAAF
jgi:hypothetical protein